MNPKRTLFLLLFSFLSTSFLSAQLRVISATGMVAQLNEATRDISETLLGGALSIDYPVGPVTLRGDVFYATPGNNDNSTAALDYLFGYRGYVGYVIGDGNRFQIPIFAGLGIAYRSEGDLTLNRGGFSGRIGARYFLTSDLALVGNVGYDRLSRINELAPTVLQLNVGLAYSYMR